MTQTLGDIYVIVAQELVDLDRVIGKFLVAVRAKTSGAAACPTKKPTP